MSPHRLNVVSTCLTACLTVAACGGGDAGPSGGDPGRSGDTDSSDARPELPATLTRYLTGSDLDIDTAPSGPGLILMGGGVEVDAAFEWAVPMLHGGDVVILRVSGSDGYNPYLYSDIGGIDSVETLMVVSRALADSDYVTWAMRHAEQIFIAGGDQSDYMQQWKDSGVETELMAAWQRGAVLGGTSAGLAVLGEFVFAAYNGSITSSEALADPYDSYLQLDRDFLALPLLSGSITDSHFANRDRMGRLVGFLARIIADGWASHALGIGIDERTALVVGADGTGQVLGQGAVYVLRMQAPATTCAAGAALVVDDLSVLELHQGDSVMLPSGTSSVPARTLSVAAGVTVPADPY